MKQMPANTLIKSSRDYPLEIATISFGTKGGAIGITFCPGKKQLDGLSGCWDRDLNIDMDAVASWGACAIVTLLQPAEMTSLQVEGLPQAAQCRGISWYHLPIADVTTPDYLFEVAWAEIGRRLRAVIRDGFRVLVHCKGGLGRAGTVAARLLVELGEDPASAIRSVRSVRPGAIETIEQAAHVSRSRTVTESTPCSSPEAIENRALGAMIGLAVGDAIGTTLEFSVRDEYAPISDMVGGGPFNLQPGQWTDDTAMAIALANSLISCGDFNEADVMERFSRWYRHGEYSCTGSCFDIGVTTQEAILRWEISGDAIAGSSDPHTAGNGSLMRLAPVALRYWNDPNRLDTASSLQSRITHGTAEAVDACRAYALLIAEAISGRPRPEVLRDREVAFCPAVAAIMGGKWRTKSRESIQSTGYVIHSLEAALWCIGRTGNFAEAVLLAANLGDDADTTAAITGQLAGAMYGMNAIPAPWRRRLAWRRKITELATRVYRRSLDT